MQSPPRYPFLIGLVLLATGCDESPTRPDGDTERTWFAKAGHSRAPSLDDRFAAMVDEISGFAGMYVAGSGELVIRVASDSEAGAGPLRDAVSAEFPSLSAMTMRVERADHDYAALNAWRRAVRPLLALDGVVSLDLDERRGKIVLGVLDSAVRSRATAAALQAGSRRV